MSFLKNAGFILLTAVIVNLIPKIFQPQLPVNFGGSVEPGFEKIANIFRANVISGEEPGAAFAVYYKGKLVVNLWGGYADEEFGVHWSRNTLGHFWSTTKGMGAIMMAMLVDRGLLDYDQPVAKYWPEFAQNGKENVTVRQLLSHQVGLPVIDVDFNSSMILTDPDGLGKLLAQQKPLWAPGSKFGYHGLTMGLYMDQLIRRIDPKHRSGQQFFADEIARPFGIDFYVGVPLEHQWKVARTSIRLASILNVARRTPSLLLRQLKFLYVFGTSEVALRAAGNPIDAMSAREHSENRQLGVISINGFGTAESVAKVFSILATGGKLKDKVLLSPGMIHGLATKEISGQDCVYGLSMNFGLGTMVVPALDGMTEDHYNTFGHFGYGGQAGFAEPNHKLGWGFTTNFMSPYVYNQDEPRYNQLVEALYDCVLKIENKNK